MLPFGIAGYIKTFVCNREKTNKKLRTHDNIESDGNKAYETRTVIRGVKGPSALALSPLIQMDTSFPVDSLHAKWIGAGKRHNRRNFFSRFGHWFIKNKNWTKLTDGFQHGFHASQGQ